MVQKNVQLTRVVTMVICLILAALMILVLPALITHQFASVPIVLLVLIGWGGMFLLQVVFPIIVIQILTWLNRKLFAQPKGEVCQ